MLGTASRAPPPTPDVRYAFVFSVFSFPVLAPAAFFAVIRNAYFVLGLRPVISTDTETAPVPDPGSLLQDAFLPRTLAGPYSNVQVVTSPPFGFTVALSTAVEALTEVALPVRTVG